MAPPPSRPLETSLERLRAAFEAHHALDDAAWAAFRPLVRTLELRRGEYFIRSGDESRDMGFLTRGILRAFYVSPKGDEKITNFCAPDMFVCAYPAFLLRRPARASIQALEDASLLRFDIAAFRALFERIPAWNHIGRGMVEAYFTFQEQRIADLITLSAQERLDRFRQSHAPIIGRLQQQQIAAYLGITRESLSRLGRK